MGSLAAGIFLTHKTKAQKFRGKCRSIFCASKKIFVRTSLCRRATLKKKPFRTKNAMAIEIIVLYYHPAQQGDHICYSETIKSALKTATSLN